MALKNIDMNIGDVNVIETSALSYAPNIFCAFFWVSRVEFMPSFFMGGNLSPEYSDSYCDKDYENEVIVGGFCGTFFFSSS